MVYVGNLPIDIKERELQDLFDKVRRAEEGSAVMASLFSSSSALSRHPAGRSSPPQTILLIPCSLARSGP